MEQCQLTWTVLLVGGSSGVGKSTVGEQLGRACGVPWLMVDDLRLAFQRSRVTLPAQTEALYFFEEMPRARRLPPERRRDALIAIGEVMSPAVEVIIENHVDQAIPVVIEGDGLLPSLLDRPPVRLRASDGRIQAVFIVEPDENALCANMRARERRGAGRTEEETRQDARAAWLHGLWLGDEARRRGLPVLEPRPWPTLAERILASSTASQM